MSSWAEAWGDAWGDSWGQIEQDTSSFYTFPEGSEVAEGLSQVQGSIRVREDTNPVILIIVAFETNDSLTELNEVSVGGQPATQIEGVVAGNPSAYHNAIEVFELSDTPVNLNGGLYTVSADFVNSTAALTAKVFVWVERSIDQSNPLSTYSDGSSSGAVSMAYASRFNSKIVTVANHQQGYTDWQTPEGFNETVLVDDATTTRVGFWVGEANGVTPSPAVIGTAFDTTRLAAVLVVINRKTAVKSVGFYAPLRRSIGLLAPLKKALGLSSKDD